MRSLADRPGRPGPASGDAGPRTESVATATPLDASEHASSPGQRTDAPVAEDRLEELKQTCTPSCSSSSVRSCTTPTWTRPSSTERVRAVPRRGARPARSGRSATATAPGSPRRSATTSSATARSSRSCATPTSPRSWSTARDHIYVERDGRLSRPTRHVHRRGPPAPHHRQDRVPGRPAGRRVEPDGRRPAARRQPGQRGHPAAGASTAPR